jgi:hypothetical protein
MEKPYQVPLFGRVADFCLGANFPGAPHGQKGQWRTLQAITNHCQISDMLPHNGHKLFQS